MNLPKCKQLRIQKYMLRRVIEDRSRGFSGEEKMVKSVAQQRGGILRDHTYILAVEASQKPTFLMNGPKYGQAKCGRE